MLTYLSCSIEFECDIRSIRKYTRITPDMFGVLVRGGTLQFSPSLLTTSGGPAPLTVAVIHAANAKVFVSFPSLHLRPSPVLRNTT